MSKSRPGRHARKIAGRNIMKSGVLRMAGNVKEGFRLIMESGNEQLVLEYGRTFEKQADAKEHGKKYYGQDAKKIVAKKPKNELVEQVQKLMDESDVDLAA